MFLTKDIISSNIDNFKSFGYYYSIIEKIEENKVTNPDISIESCKSLIEGISKMILKDLDKSLNDDQINKMDFQPLFKKSLSKLSSVYDEFEEDFVKRSNSIIDLLGQIRNKRGDISHGRLSPKETFSSEEFSRLVVSMSDGIIFYILSCFFKYKLDSTILYEENEFFNAKLDEQYPLFGKLKYSKALYDQDYISYCDELEIFLSDMENKE